MAKAKVAILISGPLRTFNTVWPKNEILLGNFNFDYHYFLHTWDESIATHKELLSGGTDKLVIRNIKPMKISHRSTNISESLAMLPKPSKIEIENFNEFKAKVPKISELPSESHVINCQNSTAMYYGMDKVATMAIDSQINFLYFLRIRPDFLLSKYFHFSKSNNVKMHGPGVSILGSRISDQCFSSKFENITSMLVFEPLIKKINLSGWVNDDLKIRRCGENALYEHWKEVKLLNLTEYPNRKEIGKIVRDLEYDDRESLWKFQQKVLAHNMVTIRKSCIAVFVRIFYRLKFKNNE